MKTRLFSLDEGVMWFVSSILNQLLTTKATRNVLCDMKMELLLV